MNDESQSISREDLHAALWQEPMTKLAANWKVPIASIVKAAQLMNVPRPAPGHWQLIKKGWRFEPESLPVASAAIPARTVIKPAIPRRRSAPTQATPSQPADKKRCPVAVPENLNHAHPMVKRTFKALTVDTYLDHGLVCGRSGDRPLSVAVSTEQVRRALRIMDAIVKGAVKLGGRFKQGEESWRWRLFLGKQPVWFTLTEVRKRSELDLDDNERKALGISRWENYDWKGTGRLRFRILGEDHVCERDWEDSKHKRLEDAVPEILDVFARVEKEAEESRARAVERKMREAELQRLRDIEWRKQAEEEEKRKTLVQMSEHWQRAQQLGKFVAACEERIQKEAGAIPAESRASRWLIWAKEHVTRLDPLEQGYLRNLVKSARGEV